MRSAGPRWFSAAASRQTDGGRARPACLPGRISCGVILCASEWLVWRNNERPRRRLSMSAPPAAEAPPSPPWRDALKVYLEPATLRMLALGFSAGLPLLLVLGTLSF